jgi:hypothetical protein
MWDMEHPTFCRESAQRWLWGYQLYVPAALYQPGRFLVLIPARDWVNPRAMVWLEGLGQLKKTQWPHRDSENNSIEKSCIRNHIKYKSEWRTPLHLNAEPAPPCRATQTIQGGSMEPEITVPCLRVPPLVPTLSHINPFSAAPSYFSIIRSNFLPSTPRSTFWLFSCWLSCWTSFELNLWSELLGFWTLSNVRNSTFSICFRPVTEVTSFQGTQ